ncbi:hypothetical protein PR202_ga28099 [Eleusine coracana subsp. coracana]|uniref:SMP domain-containing protein n=1 Tax=Eleusine coracana subsp. coracana TaxID=191504 RepID=A0AAV5DHV2_ELECO|nr:hypothetical protein QOZ80_7AG0558840 [Eleusine coracana subsp. coracana]GJN10040.1 hypothetical protein PR202_ga28099 [Eleusine coracana subsp. coracana]
MIHGEDLVRAKVVTIGEALQEVAHANKAVTIGDVFQAVARSKAGDKPVDFADAAAIQAAAEICATESGGGEPRGLVAKALQAAETNVKPADERSGGVATVRLNDVLGDAKLPDDKAVTREDVEKVATAARNNAGKRGAGTGKAVVEGMTIAADMNERRMV